MKKAEDVRVRARTTAHHGVQAGERAAQVRVVLFINNSVNLLLFI